MLEVTPVLYYNESVEEELVKSCSFLHLTST